MEEGGDGDARDLVFPHCVFGGIADEGEECVDLCATSERG